MKSSEFKTKQLGIPFGTAQNRLKKQIFFSLVQETNKDICFKCSKKIKTVEELSIEHKEPWQSVSVALFWDLNNIAFSHLKCNTASKYYGGIFKRKHRKNKIWCTSCKKFLNKEKFYNNKSRWTGKQKFCTRCIREERKT